MVITGSAVFNFRAPTRDEYYCSLIAKKMSHLTDFFTVLKSLFKVSTSLHMLYVVGVSVRTDCAPLRVVSAVGVPADLG